jgi:hypothetical protein
VVETPAALPLSRSAGCGTVVFFVVVCPLQGATIMAMPQPQNFSDFWPYYVLAHRQPATRIFHSIGTLTGWALLVAAILYRNWWLILAAVVLPYALAWFSHFFVEHNRPATFGHPLWSWLADQKMVAMVLGGKMNQEVQRCAALESSAASD